MNKMIEGLFVLVVLAQIALAVFGIWLVWFIADALVKYLGSH